MNKFLPPPPLTPHPPPTPTPFGNYRYIFLFIYQALITGNLSVKEALHGQPTDSSHEVIDRTISETTCEKILTSKYELRSQMVHKPYICSSW